MIRFASDDGDEFALDSKFYQKVARAGQYL